MHFSGTAMPLHAVPPRPVAGAPGRPLFQVTRLYAAMRGLRGLIRGVKMLSQVLPETGGMGGHAGDVDLAGGQSDEEEHVDLFEVHGVGGEEVAGQDRVGL
jgi:hypothetical protein